MSYRIASWHFSLKRVICCVVFVIFFMFYVAIWKTDITLTMRRSEFLYPGSNSKQDKYIVYTSKCMIPNVNLSHSDFKLYRPRTFIPCSNESELVSALFDVKLKRYVLHINEPVAHKILNSTEKHFNCFYREIQYGKDVETYDTLSTSKYFWQDYVVPLHVEGMLLDCETAEVPPVTIQKDAYIFIQYKESPTVTKPKKGSTPPPRKPSVIMYGIDSLSSINLRRTMPVVYEFLKGPGWFEMQGYNKVGDNSFPNILAILSGYSPEKAKRYVCDTDEWGCLDEIPMIWKYFKNASYLTAYAEDESDLNTFTYMKPGFFKKPTDYYFRPFLTALEKNTDTYKYPSSKYRNRLNYCLGRRLANSYIYDYCRQFMQRYVKNRYIFGIFWTSHFSHDDNFLPSAMQHKILGDLLDYEKDGSLDHTIMIFFADHGPRYGDILSLEGGYLEERLPMMFIYLPPWFRKQYPEYTAALNLNQHRLSSNFDLHNTLKHIIEMGSTPDGPTLPKSYDCPTCQSLFYPIAENRTCPEAGISEHWCPCEPYRSIRYLGWSERIALRVIEEMNKYFALKNLSRLCSNLSLKYIHNTEIKTGLNITSDDDLPVMETAVYRTKFKVMQNSADFKATVVFNNITEVVEVNVESISRTNSYAEDSTCINDKIAKLYCICYSDLKP